MDNQWKEYIDNNIVFMLLWKWSVKQVCKDAHKLNNLTFNRHKQKMKT